ncbi:protease SohB [Gallaecimonas xiamenensis]|uniref:Inner membrane peptidase n=1 Tax=Gallaecimonas xiamenensis 3-C-1 TaxID=745411 RepID=K2JKE0_9GAMM|nr:protease SohB [Gallaecimonas xiamenensis]EKE71019.1 inner membrane peptidase [Gallaecimonas xiamenensis 3-C-1]
MDFLSDYGLFLAKTLTLVLALVLVLVVVSALSMRKQRQKGELTVTDLGQRLKSYGHKLQAELLDKKALKAKAKAEKKQKDEQGKPNLFVLDFNGSMDAHEVDALREEVTAVLAVASSTDQVLLRLESPGGVVHGYGLAASQLARVRDAGVPLTVAVDKVAASGGYMMACVADRILAAPFAMLGSIGVIAGIPNFHKVLKKHDIDYEQHTAGKFKRTLSVLGENSEEGREKFVADLNVIHGHFRNHVGHYRPALALDDVATGEVWLGVDALEKGLVDGISTSDSYLTERLDSHKILAVKFQLRRKLGEKVGLAFRCLLTRLGI